MHRSMLRGGLTIVEVLVAMMLMTTGLLALAATSVAVTRMLARAHRAAAAATWAADRLERLRASACQETPDGTSHHGDVQLSWTVTQAGRDSRAVLVVARHRSTQGRWRTDTFQTEVLCQP